MYKTKINKLYISGSITGDLNFKQKFRDYADYIDQNYKGVYYVT